ncbi:MAG TPA: XRE family transcriptional regulator [Candidatus Binatia bacterium]|nr:XRE family transcriptional regulator [Candidatus Binatia bacterium]
MAEKVVPLASASLADAVFDEVREERLDTLRGPDSPEGRALGRAVGENVAARRREHGLGLEAVAARSGIRVDLLRALEGGQAVPSLRAVWHLATALEVPFGDLLAHTLFSEAADPDFRVQRADRGRVLLSADAKFRSRVLFREGDPRAPEVYELTLAPGCFEKAEPHAAETFEHIVVVRGELVVVSGDARAHLKAGDTIFFRADLPHSYENPTPEPTLAHLVISYAQRR